MAWSATCRNSRKLLAVNRASPWRPRTRAEFGEADSGLKRSADLHSKGHESIRALLLLLRAHARMVCGEQLHRSRTRSYTACPRCGWLRSPGVFSASGTAPGASRSTPAQASLAGQCAHCSVRRDIGPVLG